MVCSSCFPLQLSQTMPAHTPWPPKSAYTHEWIRHDKATSVLATLNAYQNTTKVPHNSGIYSPWVSANVYSCWRADTGRFHRTIYKETPTQRNGRKTPQEQETKSNHSPRKLHQSSSRRFGLHNKRHNKSQASNCQSTSKPLACEFVCKRVEKSRKLVKRRTSFS